MENILVWKRPNKKKEAEETKILMEKRRQKI